MSVFEIMVFFLVVVVVCLANVAVGALICRKTVRDVLSAVFAATDADVDKPPKKAVSKPKMPTAEERTRELVERARMNNFWKYDGSAQDAPEDIAAEQIANGGLT